MIKRPFFKYAGSKWLLSKHYPEPRYPIIIEPFAGSACYATRYYDREVILNDTNREIVDLWKYLIAVDGEEIAKLPTRRLREGQDIRELPISQGAKLLIRQWQRVGMSNCWTISKWCNKPGLWGDATRDHIAASVEKIRHWIVTGVDYLSFGGGGRPVTWFIDPPYAGLPLYGSKNMDYEKLASWCRGRSGQVIVCEQDSARWLPFRKFRKVVTGRRGQTCSKGDSAEGIWVSGA